MHSSLCTTGDIGQSHHVISASLHAVPAVHTTQGSFLVLSFVCCLLVLWITQWNCRYEGEFQNGQRHGNGALYYATGAKYEGQWQLEQKHGRGVFIFEDGTVFDGMFAHDQPVLKGAQSWGPVGPGVKLRVQDLLEDRDNKQVFLVLYNGDIMLTLYVCSCPWYKAVCTCS